MIDEALMLAQQQSMPHIDAMYWLMLASRFLHVFSAIILVGGLFYLRTVVSPAVPLPLREGRGEGSTTPVDQYFGGRRAAWAKWVGIATLFLLVTGLWNYIQIMKTHERLDSTYHMIAGIKMIAGLALFLLAALLAGRSPAAETLRTRMRFWLNICLLLGVITVALGSVLRTYPRMPKVDAAGPPQLIAPANPTDN